MLKTALSKNEDIAQSRNLSAQSIDIYACPDFSVKKDGKGFSKEEKDAVFQDRSSKCYLLIGTRNGDILEVTLEPKIFMTHEDYEESTEFLDPLDNQLIIEKIDFLWGNNDKGKSSGELLARYTIPFLTKT